MVAKSRKKPIPDFIPCPFTIVVDSNEGAPYQFAGMTHKHSSGAVIPFIVSTVKKPLWSTMTRDIRIRKGKHVLTHAVGLADYTILGFEKHIQIERKSLSDLFGTIGARRDRFEAEIKRLHEDCKSAYVIIEADWAQISIYNTAGIDPRVDRTNNPLDAIFSEPAGEDDLDFIIDSRERKGRMQPSVILGVITSWSQKYRNVHWMPCGSRSMAETITFKYLSEFYDKVQEGFYPDIVPVQNEIGVSHVGPIERPHG